MRSNLGQLIKQGRSAFQNVYYEPQCSAVVMEEKSLFLSHLFKY